jgi:hypothetical protein
MLIHPIILSAEEQVRRSVVFGMGALSDNPLNLDFASAVLPWETLWLLGDMLVPNVWIQLCKRHPRIPLHM